ncbi:MAG: hypothetical protein ACOY9Y_12265 [Bacillota bacterium]
MCNLQELKSAPLSDSQMHVLQEAERKLNSPDMALSDDHEVYLIALMRRKQG